MPDDKNERPKTITIFGENVRIIEPIKCDFCKTPQDPQRYTCNYCGAHYSDSNFDVNEGNAWRIN